MGFFDALLGRTVPVPPNLDVLFTIPPAAYTLQAAIDVQPTGIGAVCFKQAEGAGVQGALDEALALLRLYPNVTMMVTHDEFGFTWFTGKQEIIDLAELVTALHAVNSTLSEAGFGPNLLCTVIGFADPKGRRRLGLVYLFKRGTIYPFAPLDDRKRDTALELQTRAALSAELPIEPELPRWFPLWDAPVP
ncbi:PspA-associated protein PspAB [Nocardia nepalensis]|uniref:PspA-associated protein PspAB n=1 Tax=Nocardia nepalensis TaxID=3375448 RepID=UPI003B673B27